MSQIKSVQPNDIQPGLAVYKVGSVGWYINRVVLTGRIEFGSSDNNYTPFAKYSEGKNHQDFSLKDYNMIPNKYNKHAVFFKADHAELYIKVMKVFPEYTLEEALEFMNLKVEFDKFISSINVNIIIIS